MQNKLDAGEAAKGRDPVVSRSSYFYSGVVRVFADSERLVCSLRA